MVEDEAVYCNRTNRYSELFTWRNADSANNAAASHWRLAIRVAANLWTHDLGAHKIHIYHRGCAQIAQNPLEWRSLIM